MSDNERRAMPAYRSVAKFDGKFWDVRVEHQDGTLAGGLYASGLDLVAGKTRRLVESPTAEVAVDVRLPAAIEQRLEQAENLCEDAQRELEMAIRELRAEGVSVADIGQIFLARRLRPEPRPIMITNAELADFGLSRHPDALGIRWSDHGFAETTKCRACVEASRDEYLGLAEDGTNELLYDRVECDFFDIAHVEAAILGDGTGLFPTGDGD